MQVNRNISIERMPTENYANHQRNSPQLIIQKTGEAKCSVQNPSPFELLDMINAGTIANRTNFWA